MSQPGQFTLTSLDSVGSLANAQSSVHPTLSFLSLEFDVKSTVGSHVEARQAIAHAIDRTALLGKLFGTIDPSLTVNEDHLAVPWQTSYSASTAAGEYATVDLSTTDALLRSLGYTKSPAGAYVDAAGRPFTVRLAVEEGDPWIAEAAADLEAQLRAAGIAVTAFPVQGTAGLAAAAASDSYDMALVTRTATPYPSATAGWYSDGQGKEGVNDSRTGAGSTIPRWTSCSSRRPRSSIR